MQMAKVSDPIIINKTRVKNRLTMAPTVKFDYAGDDGNAQKASHKPSNFIQWCKCGALSKK